MRRKAELVAEKERLRQVVKDTIWMARRYADGRSTYAPGVVNQAIDYALSIGIQVTPDATLEDRLYARDGMFGDWSKESRRFVPTDSPESAEGET
jgi:hypothetical protein